MAVEIEMVTPFVKRWDCRLTLATLIDEIWELPFYLAVRRSVVRDPSHLASNGGLFVILYIIRWLILVYGLMGTGMCCLSRECCYG